jgi:hypothetical protein
MTTLKTLHITNGSNLTQQLLNLNIQGEFVTWKEMLCEGPTCKEIDTEEFINLRKSFFKSTYNIEYKSAAFKTELLKLNKLENYNEIVLWFEYDLFCHINLIAVISLLKQKHTKLPLHLVCSGRIKNETALKGLSELSAEQLLEHYENKIKLSVDDIALAQKAWRIYCENDHNLLFPLIVRPSNFKYLSTCLKAHIRRFADTRSGLNSLEYNILKLIHEHTITSKHHLLGYALHYQGYYGFGDLQLKRIITLLEPFYTIDKEHLTLNRKGHLAIEQQGVFFKEIKRTVQYGSINSGDYSYDKKNNILIHSPLQ